MCMQIRDVKDIAGSVKQTIKDLDIDALNLCLLPASGSMDIIRVSHVSHACCMLTSAATMNVLPHLSICPTIMTAGRSLNSTAPY